MKRTIALFVFIITAGAPGLARAGNSSYSPQFNSCMKSAKSLAEQGVCDAAEIVLQKKRLTAAYNRIAKQADPAELAALDKAQKDWIRWRDNTYSYLGEYAGTVASTNYIITEGFLLNALAEQTELLNSLADSRGL